MVENTKQRSMPPAHGRDEELYAQIAAGDEVQIQTKRRSSLVMSLMVEYMRLTLAIDALRRDYQKVFRILSRCWSSIMSVIYLCGIGMFCILLVSYMRFPSYVQNYLNENGILYGDMKIPGHIISRVKIQDLRDKKGTYEIAELDISSTFADFLNKRIKDLSVSGLKLTIDNKNPTDFFSKIINQTSASKEKQSIRVDTLKVSDSEVILKGDNYEIPVGFSLTGVYGRETNISSYITISQPALTIKGPLTIRSQGKQLSWDLDIQTGSVAFPKRPQENLSGKVTVRTNAGRLAKLSADLNLTYDKIKKVFNIKLDQKNKAFDGSANLRWLDISNPQKPIEQTKLDLNLSKLNISSTGQIKTNEPVKFDFSTTISKIKFNNLKGDLKGTLSCELMKTCSYNLQKKAHITAKSIQIPLPEGLWNSVGFSTITLEPNQNLLKFLIPDGQLNLEMNITNLSLKGKQQKDNADTSISAKEINLNGIYNIWDKHISSKLSASQLNYISSGYQINQAELVMNDIFDKSQKIYLNSSHVSLKDHPYINIPFQLDFLKENDLTSVFLTTGKNNLNISFLGYLDVLAGDINGQFIIPKFSLDSFKSSYNVSKSFNNDLKKLSGEVAAYGKLEGNINTTVNGPFYIALSDVGLKMKDLEIQGINAALSMQSLKPFVTNPKQSIFIKKIQSILPIHDIEMILRLESRFAQISSLTAKIADIPFVAEDSLIPYKDVATLIYLRNEDTNISQLKNALSIPDWNINGDLYGSIFLPIEIKNLALSIKNASIQLSDAQFSYAGKSDKKPKFLDKEKQLFVKSGNILIDAKNDTPNEVTISFLLDVLIGGNTKTKKSIRETISKNISKIIQVNDKEEKQVPQHIENQIKKIFKNIDSYQTK